LVFEKAGKVEIEFAVDAVVIGGPFRLAAHNGETIDSKALAGQPYAVFFGFTHCPDVCPTALYAISTALAKLGEQAKDFHVFFVTVGQEDTLPL
jgi:protein SCO1/2